MPEPDPATQSDIFLRLPHRARAGRARRAGSLAWIALGAPLLLAACGFNGTDPDEDETAEAELLSRLVEWFSGQPHALRSSISRRAISKPRRSKARFRCALSWNDCVRKGSRF